MVGVCQPFLATLPRVGCPPTVDCPLLLPLPRRGCGSCNLLTTTTTQANTTISSLPRFESPLQLADQWMDANPNELKQQRENFPRGQFFGGLFFINSTQSPAPPWHKACPHAVERQEGSGELRTALLPEHWPGKAGVSTSLASLVAALRWQVREGGGGNHQSGRADPVGENQSPSNRDR